MSQLGIISGTSYETPTCVGGRIEYPFRDQGDPDTKVYVHQMVVLATSYAPLSDNDTMTAATQKPIRSPFPDDANAFFIGDSPPALGDGGLVAFERAFANIPKDRTIQNAKAEPAGYYSFNFPGSPTTAELVSIVSLQDSYREANFNKFTPWPNEWRIRCSIDPADYDRIVVGDSVQVINTADVFYQEVAFGSGIGTYSSKKIDNCKVVEFKFGRVTLRSKDVFVLTSRPIIDGYEGSGSTTYTIKIDRTTIYARPESIEMNAPAFIESRYVKTDNVVEESVGLEDMFRVRSSTGQIVNSDNPELSLTTQPTVAEYAEIVKAGGFINAEQERIARWKGNIFEKQSIKVKAF